MKTNEQLARDAAFRTMPDKIWFGDTETMQSEYDATLNERTQIILAAIHEATAELQAENERLQQLVCDFQAASMLVDSSGDPGTIKPEHVEAEIVRLHKDIDATCDGLAMMSEKYMTEKINHEKTEQRAERAELLVRLLLANRIRIEKCIGMPEYALGVLGTFVQLLFMDFTNGNPDLTDEQWERLAELERGEG